MTSSYWTNHILVRSKKGQLKVAQLQLIKYIPVPQNKTILRMWWKSIPHTNIALLELILLRVLMIVLIWVFFQIFLPLVCWLEEVVQRIMESRISQINLKNTRLNHQGWVSQLWVLCWIASETDLSGGVCREVRASSGWKSLRRTIN